MRIERWFIPLIVLGLLVSASSARADDEKSEKSLTKLPKAVMKTVKANYPGAKIIGSAKEKNEEGETVYEVELMVKGKTVDLLIDAEGEIEETEKEIALSDLPTAVTKAIFKAFPKAKIEKAEEVTSEGDKVLYEIALMTKGKKVIEVVVVPNGKILKSAVVEADDKDEDDDKPKAKKKEKGEEDDDDKPKAKKKDMDEEDEEDEDEPKAKKKDMDEEDEDDKSTAKTNDEDDDKPKAKKKHKGEEDDDDKPKAKKKQKGED